MNKIKQWCIGFVAIKLVKAAINKADVADYAITAADAVDKYLDKTLGEKRSEEIQVQISKWLKKTVKVFTDKLNSN